MRAGSWRERLAAWRRRRIARPTDWLKQPFLDLQRSFSAWLARRLPPAARRPLPARIGSIVLIRRNRLGDAVNVLPVIAALRRQHPGVRIGVCANPYNAPVFTRSRLIDSLFVLPDKYWGNRYLVRWHPEVRRMRAARFDVAVNASAGFSSFAALQVSYAGARYAVGVAAAAGSPYNRVYDHADLPGAADLEQHQVMRVAGLLERAGLLSAAEVSRLRQGPYPADAPHAAGEIALDVRGIERDDGVTLCPDVNRAENAWPLARWQSLARQIAQRWPRRPLRLVLGTETSRYRALADEKGVTWAATWNFDAFADALARSRLVVCPEGGTSHVAPALGAATIVLSGRNIVKTWLPWSLHAVLLEAPGAVADIMPDELLAQMAQWLAHGGWLPTAHAFYRRAAGNADLPL